jgi:hypothetical protein
VSTSCSQTTGSGSTKDATTGKSKAAFHTTLSATEPPCARPSAGFPPPRTRHLRACTSDPGQLYLRSFAAGTHHAPHGLAAVPAPTYGAHMKSVSSMTSAVVYDPQGSTAVAPTPTAPVPCFAVLMWASNELEFSRIRVKPMPEMAARGQGGVGGYDRVATKSHAWEPW